MQLDQRPLSERVIAAGQVLQLAPVLHVRQIVVAAQVMDVTKARMRTDDEQAFGAGHGALLQLNGVARGDFSLVEVATQRLEHRELKV